MKQNSSQKRKTKGFTLVELIVVIAILAILSAVGAVAYTGYINHTKQGLDKQTVGEIERALELADYADPTLFGENGGAMVVLSKDGIKVAGGTVGSDIEGALEDAFGDLKSATLSYDKWDGAPDLDLFSKFPSGGNIDGYLSALENKGATNYAGHVEEIWDIVTTLVNGLNGNADLSGIGVKVDYGGSEPTYDFLNKIVTRTMNADKDSILNAWKDGSEFELYEDPTTKTGDRQTAVESGARLARNYAFYQYAISSPNYNPETMSGILEKLKIQGGYDYTATLSKSGKTQAVTDVAGWDDLVNGYKDVAEQDVNAYLAMMEAASTVKGTDSLQDDAYLKAVSSYTGMLDNVLSGAVDFDSIKTLATGATGNVIVVSATKVNGTLKFNVSPETANPREEAVAEEVQYTENGATFTLSGNGGDEERELSGIVIIKPNSVVVINVKGSSNNPFDFTGFNTESAPDGVTCTVDNGTLTISSLNVPSASGQIVLLKTTTNFTGTVQERIKINITVK